MKKNLLAASLATVLLASASIASAAVPETFYVGLRGGFAHLDWSDDNSQQQLRTVDDDKSGYGLGLYAGYNFNQNFALEGGYNYFTGFSAYDTKDKKSLDLDFHGPELAFRVALPLSDNGSDVFLRAGAMYAFGEGSSDGIAPLVGIGANIAFSKSLGLRVGYDRYFNAYNDEDVDIQYKGINTDIDFVYVGLHYSFGGAPAPAPKEPVTKTVTVSYSLDANTLFGFDSDVLSADGKKAISGVINESNKAKLQGVKYSLVGHTDRLGNAEYNQKLSQKRADSVAAELVNNGVPSSAIESTGVGAADPVTGSTCDNLSGKELIQCLAPDRRVVVNVTGTTNKVEVVKQ